MINAPLLEPTANKYGYYVQKMYPYLVYTVYILFFSSFFSPFVVRTSVSIAAYAQHISEEWFLCLCHIIHVKSKKKERTANIAKRDFFNELK